MNGAIFPEQHRVGEGCVLRDDQGLVVIASMKPEQNTSDPFQVKLLALLQVLQFCVPLGI